METPRHTSRIILLDRCDLCHPFMGSSQDPGPCSGRMVVWASVYTWGATEDLRQSQKWNTRYLIYIYIYTNHIVGESSWYIQCIWYHYSHLSVGIMYQSYQMIHSWSMNIVFLVFETHFQWLGLKRNHGWSPPFNLVMASYHLVTQVKVAQRANLLLPYREPGHHRTHPNHENLKENAMISNLAGGWVTALRNMKVNWDDDIPTLWKNKKMFQTTIFQWYSSQVGQKMP